jgi:hypothetical protein
LNESQTGCLLDRLRGDREVHCVIGLEGVRGAIFDIAYSDVCQLVTQTGLNELPEWVQVGDLFMGFLQGRDVELVVEDYISDIAENFA